MEHIEGGLPAISKTVTLERHSATGARTDVVLWLLHCNVRRDYATDYIGLVTEVVKKYENGFDLFSAAHIIIQWDAPFMLNEIMCCRNSGAYSPLSPYYCCISPF